MDRYILELFARAQPFGEGDLALDRDYRNCMDTLFALEDQMGQQFGAEAAHLLQEYIHYCFEMEWFESLHYFSQGYLAAQEEPEKQKDP
ncbi:MAG: hypothetical protein HFF07_06775 [Oscillospiraceae bacterium]|jgi:hypothetical protein|nr:hypothetical protein [Oscillospiraceae bacterium]